MKTHEEVLSSILKTAQMGQIGIRTVLDLELRPEFRKALESQLLEYDNIESEAHSICNQNDWSVPELDPAIRKMTEMMSRMRFQGKNQQSRIASAMITGNSKGIIKGGKTLHHMYSPNTQVANLSKKLLETETANICQMQAYL